MFDPCYTYRMARSIFTNLHKVNKPKERWKQQEKEREDERHQRVLKEKEAKQPSSREVRECMRMPHECHTRSHGPVFDSMRYSSFQVLPLVLPCFAFDRIAMSSFAMRSS